MHGGGSEAMGRKSSLKLAMGLADARRVGRQLELH
jgi:hypothetical protein